MAEENTQQIGPYEVLGLIGRGGMGAVYRARHPQSGVEVAVKAVRTATAAVVPTIRREIAALERLRHPYVVRIVESGLDKGLPWFAMELVKGVELRAYWRRPGEAVLDLMAQLCGALAYVHGEGIVHHDLKPENVLVREDGAPLLVDFGLAAEFGGDVIRERLEVEEQTAGSLLYMAPERIRGELTDARADLYALGCMVYEYLAGRPPFAGATVRALVRGHLEGQAERLRTVNPQVSAELDELVHRLLEKHPDDRLGYASDVARVLLAGRPRVLLNPPPVRLRENPPRQLRPHEQGGIESGAVAATPSSQWAQVPESAGGVAADTGAEPRNGHPKPRPYLYRPPFVGRAAILAEIEERLAALRGAGSGGALFLGGESGVGKTRLVVEAGRRAAARDLVVLTGNCLPPTAGHLWSEGRGDVPLQALRGPLRKLADRCREWGQEETDRLFGARARLLAAFEPSLRHLPGQDAYPEPVVLARDEGRLRLFAALGETLGQMAAECPVLLVLDDLHWADELTLAWLEHWLHRLADRPVPVLVLAAYRTEAAPQALLDLAQLPFLSARVVDRLTAADVDKMVRSMLSLRQVPAGLVELFARHSAGNPLFVAELLRASVEEGLLHRDLAGRWRLSPAAARVLSEAPGDSAALLPLPRALRDLVEHRLRGLGGAALELVEAAAVLGRESTGALLAAVSGLAGEVLFAALQETLRKHVIRELSPDRFAFVHDKLREAAYARIGEGRRAGLHRAAAGALETLPEEEREQLAGALGDHWAAAGERRRAARAWAIAGRKAAGAHAAGEAWTWLTRAAEAFSADASGPGADTPRLLEVLDLRCVISDQLGRSDAILQDARSMAGLALGGADVARYEGRGHYFQGLAWIGENRFADALAELTRAVTLLARPVPDASWQVALWHREAWSWRGWALMGLGQWDEGLRELQAAVSADLREADSPIRDGCLMRLANACELRGDLERAEGILNELKSRSRARGLAYQEAQWCAAVGRVRRAKGESSAALAMLQEAKQGFRACGALQEELVCLNEIGQLLKEQGRYGAACNWFAEMTETAQRHHRAAYALPAAVQLAGCELRLGQTASARERLRAARQSFAQGGETRWHVECLVWAARAAAVLGDRSGAGEAAHEAHFVAARGGTARDRWKVAMLLLELADHDIAAPVEAAVAGLAAADEARRAGLSSHAMLAELRLGLHEARFSAATGPWTALLDRLRSALADTELRAAHRRYQLVREATDTLLLATAEALLAAGFTALAKEALTMCPAAAALGDNQGARWRRLRLGAALGCPEEVAAARQLDELARTMPAGTGAGADGGDTLSADTVSRDSALGAATLPALP
ncbi:MAG: protein kinase [Candidatus Schekmanbacteria bacterium]|nr:protein kinase [Candidatus Schekmanbacteria bacterium]